MQCGGRRWQGGKPLDEPSQQRQTRRSWGSESSPRPSPLCVGGEEPNSNLCFFIAVGAERRLRRARPCLLRSLRCCSLALRARRCRQTVTCPSRRRGCSRTCADRATLTECPHRSSPPVPSARASDAVGDFTGASALRRDLPEQQDVISASSPCTYPVPSVHLDVHPIPAPPLALSLCFFRVELPGAEIRPVERCVHERLMER